MSDILKHIEENPKETRRLIGLEYEQLQQLIENAEKLNYEKQVLLESKKIRIITGGGGRKPKLSVKEQIIWFFSTYYAGLLIKVRHLP